MPIAALQSNDAMDDGLPPESNDVPAWLLNRRERRTGGEAIGVEQMPVPQAAASQIPDPQEPDPEAVLTFPPALPRVKRKPVVPVIDVTKSSSKDDQPTGNWLRRWISRQGLIGVVVSLLLHTTVLVTLAFILMTNAARIDEVQIWGVPGDVDEVGENMVLDTIVNPDGGESAPVQMDVGQAIEGIGPGFESVDPSIFSGKGGHGKGQGDGGSGMGVGAPMVPGHAQTKGSFSAWTEPRDPKPNENYFIVIQIRLPRTAKKYRATDLTGLVTGTDKFKQDIRYKPGETFPVENGACEIRILVPGGAQRVRDTIHVESKMLHEKQTFEIEF